jgi:sugar phosphate isomerase/epimerase
VAYNHGLADRLFGATTRLFRATRLTRDHLVDIAAHAFDAVEVYVEPDHFDPRDESSVTELAEWLSDTQLALHALRVTPTQGDGVLTAALAMAERVPYRFLVVPRPVVATDRALQTVADDARPRGVTVAVEVGADGRSTAETLVQWLEDDDLEDVGAGICLDMGHAHLHGDVGEALETASGHLVTMHVHDNRGRTDDHLVPYAGTINWDVATMEMQKIGYDGALMFDLAPSADPVDVLRRARAARERLERAFITF